MKLSLKKLLKSDREDGYTIFLCLMFIALYLFVFSLFYLAEDILSSSLSETAYMITTTFLNHIYLLTIIYPFIYLLYRILPTALFKPLFVLFLGLFATYVYLDSIIYNLFKFHVNSFILKVLGQKGALQVLGLGFYELIIVSSFVILGVIISFFIFNWLSHSKIQLWFSNLLRSPLRIVIFTLIFTIVMIGEKGYYAWLVYNRVPEVIVLSKKVPLYVPPQAGRIFKKLGFTLKNNSDHLPAIKVAKKQINYPLQPYTPKKIPSQKLPNVILLMSDALRSDVYNRETMPNSTKFFQDKAINFTNHFSGSNGTTEGLFSLLYGLPATYMGYFSKADVSPVFFDFLLANRYEIKIFSSKSLGWMGTDQVIFSTVKEYIVDELDHSSIISDQMVTAQALTTIDEHAKNQQNPLFLMVFYDSTHLPHFKYPEVKKFLPEDTTLIFDPSDKKQRIRGVNEYKNAVYFVDQLFGQIYKKLEQLGYSNKSIIILTSDHGSEKYEHGHWGHASAFTNEQLHTPLLLSVPGLGSSVIDRLTSHMDVMVTLLELMGETYKPEYHSIGRSLLKGATRDYILAGGMANRVLMDGKYKIDYTPFEVISYYKVTDASDNPVADADKIIEQYTPKILNMFDDFQRFLK
jgi:membrane-anchored protein YejM (alkaline phosphatase superfamily)